MDDATQELRFSRAIVESPIAKHGCKRSLVNGNDNFDPVRVVALARVGRRLDFQLQSTLPPPSRRRRTSLVFASAVCLVITTLDQSRGGVAIPESSSSEVHVGSEAI